LIAEMRTIQLVAGQCSIEGPEDTKSLMASAEAERCRKWADELDAALASLEPQEPDYGAGLHEERRQRLAAQEPTTDHATAHALLTAWRAEDATLPPEAEQMAVFRAWFERGWNAALSELDQHGGEWHKWASIEAAYLAATTSSQEPR
jgi:hypothetical protein